MIRVRPLAALAAALPILLGGCAEPRAGTGDAEAPSMTQLAAAHSAHAAPASDPVVQVYKTPTCGCCAAWVDHVEEMGLPTEVHDLPDVTAIKHQHGVPAHLGSCHTAVVGRYVVEGHVPADVIRRLLAEQPDVRGIAVPGMPMGSPGMEGPRRDRYDVIAFRADGSEYVFESR
jgi:hypothetical protein